MCGQARPMVKGGRLHLLLSELVVEAGHVEGIVRDAKEVLSSNLLRKTRYQIPPHPVCREIGKKIKLIQKRSGKGWQFDHFIFLK